MSNTSVVISFSWKAHQDFTGMVRDGKCSEIITTYSFLLPSLFSINSLIYLC